MSLFQNILVPTDFSEGADAAVQEAVEVAKLTGGQIRLLHIYHLAAYPEASTAPSFYESALNELNRQASEQILKAEQRVRDQGVPVSSALFEGPPFEGIIDYARREKVDLIVIGTRGLTGLKHVLLGSVAERTVRLADCPVLTVKAAGS